MAPRDSTFWERYRYFRGVSRAKEQRVKEQLKALFPSFSEEIDRMRIRHHLELLPILERTDSAFREHALRALYANGGRTPGYYKDLEEYVYRSFARGYYGRGRTINVSYFPDRPELGFTQLHGVHVHEAVHYLTELLLRDAFGRAVDVEGSGRYVPTDVREALAFAFQHAFWERMGIPVNHEAAMDDVVSVYSRVTAFDADRFRRTYTRALQEINERGFDGAARRIPEIVAEILGLRPRNVFKRR